MNFDALTDDHTAIAKLNKIPTVLFNDMTIPNKPNTSMGNNP